MCNSVLRTRTDNQERIRIISDIQQGYVKTWDKLINEWKSDSHVPNGFDFEFVHESYDIQFTGEDVANDCFHPSISAHEKVAQLLLRLFPN